MTGTETAFMFEVKIVKTEVVLRRLAEIERALDEAFSEASFIEADHDIGRPIEHTLEVAFAIPVAHILVLDMSGRIIGGVFCIPTSRADSQTSCDIGWMFVAPSVPRIARRLMQDALVAHTVEIAQFCGFRSIVTQMGTEAGAHVLRRLYGFTHEPTATQPNRWVKHIPDSDEARSTRPRS